MCAAVKKIVKEFWQIPKLLYVERSYVAAM